MSSAWRSSAWKTKLHSPLAAHVVNQIRHKVLGKEISPRSGCNGRVAWHYRCIHPRIRAGICGPSEGKVFAVPVILVKNWWSLVVRGLAAIALGLITVVRHGITLGQLELLFGGYAIVDGLLSLAGAIRAAESGERWAPLATEGLVGIAAGIVTYAWPAIPLVSFGYIVAVWAFLTGGLELAAALQLRKHVSGEWMLMFGGIASLVLGLLMIAIPFVTPLAVAFWIGVYSLVFGTLLVELGLRLRSWAREHAIEGFPIAG